MEELVKKEDENLPSINTQINSSNIGKNSEEISLIIRLVQDNFELDFMNISINITLNEIFGLLNSYNLSDTPPSAKAFYLDTVRLEKNMDLKSIISLYESDMLSINLNHEKGASFLFETGYLVLINEGIPYQVKVTSINYSKSNFNLSYVMDITELPKNYRKAFLGGYRDRNTNIEYHNASAQTRPQPIPPPEKPVFSRDTQTNVMKHFRLNTVKETQTQINKPGFHVSSINDKLITPHRYETADEYHKRVLEAVIIIQKYYRRLLAIKYVDQIRKQKMRVEAWLFEQKERLKKERDERIANDLRRRLHPRNMSDFERLYNSLDEWRTQELLKIYNSNRCEAEQKAALSLITDKEIELMDTIEYHKSMVNMNKTEIKQHGLLKKAAQSKKWICSRTKKPLEMQTAYTVRGKELFDIYETLRLDCLTQDERMDILLTVKHTVKEHESSLTREILELVDREAYFILNGTSSHKLAGLRKRILNRFAAYAKTPEYNPQIANFLRLPTGTVEGAKWIWQGDLIYCSSCEKYKRSSAFSLTTRRIFVSKCKQCEMVINLGLKRIDMHPFRIILQHLRETEQNLEKENETNKKQKFVERLRSRIDETGSLDEAKSLATTDIKNDKSLTKSTKQMYLLINEFDVQHIISEIWDNRSVLSGWPAIIDLCLSRWKVNEPWSPWNCILLTKEEAEIHRKSALSLELDQMYGSTMLYRVKQRHVIATNVFRRLFLMSNKFTEKKSRITEKLTKNQKLSLILPRLA